MRFPLLLILFCWSFSAIANDSIGTAPPIAIAVADTTQPVSEPAPVESADALLSGLTDSIAAPALLPDRMLFTQRALWGKKGLMRAIGAAPLTVEGRENELRTRRTMFKLHQLTGFLTLAGFIAQGIVGSQLYNAQGEDYTRLKNIHESLATGINIAYGTTALLSFTSPPPAVGQRRGLSTMVATNVLASRIREDFTLKPYHRAAAYTTFGAFTAAIVVLKF
jgi:hypothetical protein